jgi:cbb3-type cytochrome c oxidase subunit III
MRNIPISKKWSIAFLYLTGLLFSVFIASCISELNAEINAVHPLMGAGYGINSSTLIVKDLDSTKKYYNEVLGFELTKFDLFGRSLFSGVKNAMIAFPDMATIQLLSVDDSANEASRLSFIREFSQENEGIRLYSLSSSSANDTYEWLSKQGVETDSIRGYRMQKQPEGEWSRDDGGPHMYRVAIDSVSPSAYVPEFIQLAGFPYERMHEWASFYYRQRVFITHPNGAVGIAAIQIAVEDLEAQRKEFRKMGFKELEGEQSENLARFQLKHHQELQLRSPHSSEDELGQFLKNRGSGVFAITFEVKDIDTTHNFFKEKLSQEAFHFDSLAERVIVYQQYANGVQLEFIQEPKEQALMAEKLKMGFGSKLDSTAQVNAENLYLKYCALCHGNDREGYAADNAPSLRSHSLMATAKNTNFLRYTVQYGRAGTAMAGFYKEQGGPLEQIEIDLLLQWLYESSGVEEPIDLSRESITGDIELGASLYQQNCAVCHGENGEGVSAPALGRPMLLATATDHFLRYAISEGRDGTPMPAFKDSLKDNEIDALTAFLRSRASGWNVPKPDTVSIPLPENYVLNPNGQTPKFELREGRYVSAKQVAQALKDSMRFIVLDARSTVAWRQMHIPGAIPVPHYEEPDAFVEQIPKDSTWVVAYCACPHAASGKVINTLRRYGFKHTAIIDEGILVWAQEGYPVQHGQ